MDIIGVFIVLLTFSLLSCFGILAALAMSNADRAYKRKQERNDHHDNC